MRQILQNLRDGELLVEDVPAPKVRPGHLLIQTTRTLISAGTERMVVEFGRANLINKARQQPEKVRQVLNKMKTDGVMATFNAVSSKLDQPMPLGYCNVGRVLAVGDGVEGFQVGDRVVSNGRHAEIVCVPRNLCILIPKGVSDEQATFTVLSSIGLQGIRLLNPTLGERVAVFGLGLIGLVSVQILKANGVSVIGFDYDGSRVALAREYGVESHDLSTGVDPVAAGMSFSKERGVDGVLVTASTSSNDLMHQAAQMCRKRGRIVLTGVTGLQLNRSDFYEKELSFQVSCSYGPGRYDPFYEDQGNDYPLPFVRWTENRNMEAILELLEDNRIQVEKLISMRTPLDKALEAYDAVAAKKALGVLLEFPESSEDADSLKRRINYGVSTKPESKVVAAVIGAGNYTQIRMLPYLKKAGIRLKWIASSGGTSAAQAAKKFGFENAATDNNMIFQDEEVNAVFITTRHGSHAKLVKECLRQGKHVFVEKPLCLNPEELEDIEAMYAGKTDAPILMVGFNRRFSPFAAEMHHLASVRSKPLAMTYTCNAGYIPPEHWVQDPVAGGGRIIGEACHFIDLMTYFSGSLITQVSAMKQDLELDLEDVVTLSLKFADGSIANINYFANGHKSMSKETCHLFYDGKTIFMDNFRGLKTFGINKKNKNALLSQEKGHNQGYQAFIDSVRNGTGAPIPIEQIFNTTRATFAAMEAMRHGKVVQLEASTPMVEV